MAVAATQHVANQRHGRHAKPWTPSNVTTDFQRNRKPHTPRHRTARHLKSRGGQS